MTISEKLLIVKTILTSVAGDLVYHYRRPAGLKRYVIWQEDAEDSSLFANDKREELCLTGTVDLFTQNEFDSLIDNLQEAFDSSSRVSTRIESVTYEDETGLIHYAWTFWVA